MEKYALMAAAFGALAITAASGLLIIPALRRLHFGQTIKEIGPTWHQGKNGTPTMGGLTFYLGVLVGVVLGYTVLALSVLSLLGGWLSGTSVSLFIRRADHICRCPFVRFPAVCRDQRRVVLCAGDL